MKSDIKDIVDRKWYFIVKKLSKNSILEFANNFWLVLDQTWKWEFLVDIKPTKWYDTNHPQKWINFLDLHIDWFFKKLDIRPDYILLYCVNPGEWGKTILCSLEDVFDSIVSKYWEETYQKIINLGCFWKNNTFYIWSSLNKIYQDIKYDYYDGPLMKENNSKKYYSLSDNFKHDKYLEILKKEIDKNVFCIGKLEKGDLIIINNFSYLHWRKKVLSNNRHLIRIQLKESFNK